jgi:hypothetical protein
MMESSRQLICSYWIQLLLPLIELFFVIAMFYKAKECNITSSKII